MIERAVVKTSALELKTTVYEKHLKRIPAAKVKQREERKNV
jgi:hypothetical protein